MFEPKIEIRLLDNTERLNPDYYQMADYAFRPTGFKLDVEAMRENLPYLAERQTYVLLEDGQYRAQVSYLPMTQALRGDVWPMAGIAGVVTHPYGRRKGYSRQLMQVALTAAREAGYIMTALYPFRESFYARMGYVTLPAPRWLHIPATAFTPLLELELESSIELRAFEEGQAEYQSFLRDHQAGWHGLSLFSDHYAHLYRKQAYNLAIARDERGAPIGLLRYESQGHGEPFLIWSFLYTNSLGKFQLLEWLARHIGQAAGFVMVLPPDDRIETWLYDAIPSLNAPLPPTPFEAEAPMGRVLDVQGLHGLKLGAEGELSATIQDDLLPWNNGTFRFSSEGGQLRVSQTTQADCLLSINALSALIYYGADPADFRYRAWGDVPESLQPLLRAMFPPAMPYLHETF